jgi:hypothetical protein
MTKETFYKKQGRRYIPIREYDSNFLDAFREGSHLVVSRPGHTIKIHNIDPNYASLIAAGQVAKDRMTSALVKASSLRPSSQPITQAQRDAWDALSKAFGKEMMTLTGSSAVEIAQAGLEALIEEAIDLMKNETVRASFEQFLMVCELTKENKS